MPTYSGKFRYSTDPVREGPCQFTFTSDTCTLIPSSGPAIAFDLGDVDLAVRQEWDLELTLFSGRHLVLRQFGAAFDRMAGELMAAWRERTIQCLMLEDLERVATYSGVAGLAPEPPVPAEIHLFKSNLAILPLAAIPYQWRLAEVDAIGFSPETYALTLASGERHLKIAKLGKKTDEFHAVLRRQFDTLRQHSAEALQQTFPFLDPERLTELLTTMPEGCSAPFAKLEKIHPDLTGAIIKRTVDDRLRPYFDALRAKSVEGSIMAGYKFIRPDEEQEETEKQDNPLFFWFFFPLAGVNGKHCGLAAWEASTGSGRATYFFRTHQSGEAAEHVEAAIEKLTQALALVSFRREPIYLSDESLFQTPQFHRYAIGCRKLPVLRDLRADYAGRAIHSNLQDWTTQFENIISGTP